jgi:hypothetical protein
VKKRGTHFFTKKFFLKLPYFFYVYFLWCIFYEITIFFIFGFCLGKELRGIWDKKNGMENNR